MKKLVYAIFFMLMALGTSVFAQDWGYTNGDRVFGNCYPTFVEIYGIDPSGNGVQLTVFNYSTLFTRGAGEISAQTSLGQVILQYDLRGNFRVYWIGGPFFATGSGDYTKAFTCQLPALIAIPMPIGVPPATGQQPPTPQQNIIAQQTITYNGTTVNQTVTVTSGTATCARGSQYVVRRGDTLFHISRLCGTTVDALVHANNIVNRNRIYVGQVLIIP